MKKILCILFFLLTFICNGEEIKLNPAWYGPDGKPSERYFNSLPREECHRQSVLRHQYEYQEKLKDPKFVAEQKQEKFNQDNESRILAKEYLALDDQEKVLKDLIRKQGMENAPIKELCATIVALEELKDRRKFYLRLALQKLSQ